MFRSKLAKNSIFLFLSFRIKNANDDASLIGLSDYEKKFIRQKSKCIFIVMSLFNAHMPVFLKCWWVQNSGNTNMQSPISIRTRQPDPSLHFYLDELKPFSRCFWSTTILSERKIYIYVDIHRFIWYENRLYIVQF